MNESRAAVRYAKAVLGLAVENNATEAVENDMRNIMATISGSPELRGMLASPLLKREIKKEALSAVFTGSNPITDELFTILAENKRISLLQQVAEKFIILNETRKGQEVATVTTAVPLTEELEKQILDKVVQLTGNKSSLKNKVDQSIIGGFILRVGDTQYDASIAHKLENLRREFTNSL